MSQLNRQVLNIAQNQPDYELEPISEQSFLFKTKVLTKSLEPPKDDPENPEGYRGVTVVCNIKGCRQVIYFEFLKI